MMFGKFWKIINKMQRSCGTKIRHRSYDEALLRLNGIKKRGKITGLEIYPCKFCNGWHLGHPKKPVFYVDITSEHSTDDKETGSH